MSSKAHAWWVVNEISQQFQELMWWGNFFPKRAENLNHANWIHVNVPKPDNQGFGIERRREVNVTSLLSEP
jgi:hypothetical protein